MSCFVQIHSVLRIVRLSKQELVNFKMGSDLQSCVTVVFSDPFCVASISMISKWLLYTKIRLLSLKI